MRAYGRIVAVIPTLNEAEMIGQIVNSVKRYVDGVFVIDGNSSDGTTYVAKLSGADVTLQNENGKGQALRQAFASINSDIVVILDADGSMIAEEIPLLIQSLQENSEIDIVKGSRFLPGGYSEDMNFIRRIGNMFFVFIVNFLWATRYTDLCYGFGAFRKRALSKLLPHLESQNFEIETEICIKAKKLGLRVLEVPSVELRRTHGKSRLNTIRDGVRILKTILKELRNSRH